MTEASTESHTNERVFLHDICNALAVVQGSLHIVIFKGKKVPPAITFEQAIERLQKGLEAVEKLNTLVSARRDYVVKEAESTK
ncbi:MAG: hypothetical protein NT027_04415 [Proteobacteria bacterium]|nr:hypothetical protein [Pseudomonadota bacterium]